MKKNNIFELVKNLRKNIRVLGGIGKKSEQFYSTVNSLFRQYLTQKSIFCFAK